ncbi:hypothetical protein UC34_02005 [Pandoraea vervacti]|uniref:DUF2946 domain-containing protein n=1 Tax=Pandoraea vervacti TaxID=656178 RepID=A0ABM5SUG8_9BURK|nr:hypothetical protein [Pandoraea vervacti]AJP56096.1 hypothetical protein UC34_02005 [Pandoraea vervacti]
MNRWRKLLVLLLLCVTMPLQAMAALRTHCAPGTPATSTQAVAAKATETATMARHLAMMSGGVAVDDSAMPGAHHHGDDGVVASGDALASSNDLPDSHDSHDSRGAHSLHASCSACAACVVCTALPQSVALRVPDAQPSAAIPFLRTSAASAVVAVPERPPKPLAV